jgi:thioredoxin 1
MSLNKNKFVLVDFFATWCEPCKWAEPVLEETIRHFNGKVILEKSDIDEFPDRAKENHVLSVPTLILYKEGKEIWRMRGFETAPVMIQALGKFLD